MKILPLQNSSEISRLASLAASIWREHYTPIIGAEQVEYMLDKFQSATAIEEQIADGWEYYLAWRDEDSVGYLALIPDTADGSCKISKIYTTAAARGTGAGRCMLELAKQRCRELGLARLWLTVNRDNPHSIQWYARQGFENTGPVVADIGNGYIMDDYRMELTINPGV